MKRRGRGEGSIFKRSDGRWAAYVSTGGGDRRYLYGRTRQEVAQKLLGALKAHGDGLPLPGERETVGSFFPTWVAGQRHRLRPSTWTRYEQYIRVHVVTQIGSVPLSKLSPQHLDRLYDNRLRAGLSTTTVLHIHRVIHRGLESAMRYGLVARNVAKLVDPPQARHFEMAVLSVEQVHQLLDAAGGPPLEALIAVAVSTGMRKGELLALRWADVDLERRVVSVKGTLQRINGELRTVQPKTRKSRRQVELATFAVDALRRHKAAQAQQRLLVGPDWNGLDLVFPNVYGRPQEGWHLVYSRFYRLLDKAGLPRIRFHDLRHTAASLMLSRGVHPKIVSEMLGHSTIAITLDLYSHVTPTMQRRAADAMDELMRR